jgi:hypothetical protein
MPPKALWVPQNIGVILCSAVPAAVNDFDCAHDYADRQLAGAFAYFLPLPGGRSKRRIQIDALTNVCRSLAVLPCFPTSQDQLNVRLTDANGPFDLV